MPDAIRVCLIVAVAENGVIGAGNSMPWRLPSDLRRFKALTMGHPIIMGRRTFLSIGRPLPGRTNIVISRQPDFAPSGAIVAPTPERALELARQAAIASGVGDVFVIGGAEIYSALAPQAMRAYLTLVHARPDGDARFALPGPPEWIERSREAPAQAPGDDHATTFLMLDRATPVAMA